MINRLVELISHHANKYNEREAIRFQDYATGAWKSISWTEFKAIIEKAARSLDQLGITEQNTMGIFTQNCVEILITHFAGFYNRAVSVPIYATSSQKEVEFITDNAETKLLFVGDAGQYEIARAVQATSKSIEHIIIYNSTVEKVSGDTTTLTWEEFIALGEKADPASIARLEARTASGSDQDLAYLIYTSGTTGTPKGVMLTHYNFDKQIDAHIVRLRMIKDTDTSMSFLPLSHVFELGWTMVCLTVGITVFINTNTKEIQKALRETNPTCMSSVPRFWEKVYAGIQEKKHSSPLIARYIIKGALIAGFYRNCSYIRRGKKVPFWLEGLYRVADKIVLSKIRQMVGLPNTTILPTAGAAISDNIARCLIACGFKIVVGYGLSETTATVSCFVGKDYNIGTIGTPLQSLEVKIGENNEILVKGPSVMVGYYRNPEATAQAFTQDGFFRTGDAGYLTAEGELVMTERIKDLFKTSNGKYIAPQVLETKLTEDKFIEQVAIIGDRRKFVSAIIVPAFAELKAYAEKNKIRYKTIEELVKHSDIIKMVNEHIQELQKDLASFEQIKKFVLLPHPFSMERGEITNTLKIRRTIINKLYSREIEAMYV